MKKQFKLGRKKSNRQHLVKNQVTSLFAYERIVTTLPKAKLTQRSAERIISNVVNSDDLNGYRFALKETGHSKIAKKLVEVIKKQYADSKGGYTRILNIGNRKGDNARMVILELTKKIDQTSDKTTKSNDADAKESKDEVKKNTKEDAKKQNGKNS